MTLHLFNPEHDIALAANLGNFTAPHAARKLRHDLGWLPALWAETDDVVLVDDVDWAASAYAHFLKSYRLRPAWRGAFWQTRKAGSAGKANAISPWGWDKALCAQLLRYGCDQQLLPAENVLDEHRRLASRQLAACLLGKLRTTGTIGEAFVCSKADELPPLLEQYEHIVLKAPWSSSGRGLRFVDAERNTLTALSGWIANTLEAQGCLMAEPYYNKIKDFGMEFMAHPDGHVDYEGLSLFHTKNGAYTGNVLATETERRHLLSRYLPLPLLDRTAAQICSLMASWLEGRYVGPFGVDMMVCASLPPANGTAAPAFLLHPCVEVNLRRTMGHVALGLSRMVNPGGDDDVKRVMRIELNDYYQLKLYRE